MTTAQKLIAYRQELMDAGLSPELINEMVRDASQTLIVNEGLKVPFSAPQASKGE